MNWRGIGKGVKEGVQPFLNQMAEEISGRRQLGLAKQEAVFKTKLGEVTESRKAKRDLDRIKTRIFASKAIPESQKEKTWTKAALDYLGAGKAMEEEITPYQKESLRIQEVGARNRYSAQDPAWHYYQADMQTARSLMDDLDKSMGKKALVNGQEVVLPPDFDRFEIVREQLNSILGKYGQTEIPPFESKELERVSKIDPKVMAKVIQASKDQGVPENQRNIAKRVSGHLETALKYRAYRSRITGQTKPEAFMEPGLQKEEDPAGIKKLMDEARTKVKK